MFDRVLNMPLKHTCNMHDYQQLLDKAMEGI